MSYGTPSSSTVVHPAPFKTFLLIFGLWEKMTISYCDGSLFSLIFMQSLIFTQSL